MQSLLPRLKERIESFSSFQEVKLGKPFKRNKMLPPSRSPRSSLSWRREMRIRRSRNPLPWRSLRNDRLHQPLEMNSLEDSYPRSTFSPLVSDSSVLSSLPSSSPLEPVDRQDRFFNPRRFNPSIRSSCLPFAFLSLSHFFSSFLSLCTSPSSLTTYPTHVLSRPRLSFLLVDTISTDSTPLLHSTSTLLSIMILSLPIYEYYYLISP